MGVNKSTAIHTGTNITCHLPNNDYSESWVLFGLSVVKRCCTRVKKRRSLSSISYNNDIVPNTQDTRIVTYPARLVTNSQPHPSFGLHVWLALSFAEVSNTGTYFGTPRRQKNKRFLATLTVGSIVMQKEASCLLCEIKDENNWKDVQIGNVASCSRITWGNLIN